jgi:ankyrin repeat protein
VNLPIVQQGDSNVLPIHYAIQYNNVDLLHFLLRHEVDVNAECEIPQSKLKYTGHTIIQAQQTPLMTAMFLERSNMCKILVEAGANMHCIFYVFDGFWPFSCNPLRFAMAFQNVELVKYFLEKGCFIDQDTQNAVKLAEKQYSKRILEVVRSNLKKQQESVCTFPHSTGLWR